MYHNRLAWADYQSQREFMPNDNNRLWIYHTGPGLMGLDAVWPLNQNEESTNDW
jgi:hypothetical protein